ncbi:MAG: DNA cytosine methyltransferase [bacterium]|nr:DNA cytosine methyltransferase [bacterium]
MLEHKLNNKKEKKYSTVSLFAGCGGLDLGLTGNFNVFGKNFGKRNFDVIWANDIDENACFTFRKNLKKIIVCGDIVKLLNNNYPDLFSPKMPESADVVVGGFPCQDFSLAGKRKGFETKRGNLYKSMVETVRRVRPILFIAENVKGLLSMNNGKAIETIKEDFANLDYDVDYKLFHVADFGVPENRERVIIIGIDKKRNLPKFIFPEPVLNKEKRITLSEAIGDLEEVKEGDAHNHFWSKAKYFAGTQGNSFVNKDKIGPTMRAEHHGNIEFHWNKKRRLSAREAARIQSFPDDFIFYPSTSSAYKQIGNAVPPVFAWHIAGEVENFLNKYL